MHNVKLQTAGQGHTDGDLECGPTILSNNIRKEREREYIIDFLVHQFVFLLNLLVEDERALSSFDDQKIEFANELVFTYANIFIFLFYLNSSRAHMQPTVECVYQTTKTLD